MKNMTQALSYISRTNQLKITEPVKEFAEKLYLYLFKIGRGIECFSIKDLDFGEDGDSNSDFYQRRHKAIKHEIKKRLSDYGEEYNYSEIHYFMTSDKRHVFFLTPDKTHSGWRKLFCKESGNREKILNLIFKFHILSEELLDSKTADSFERLLLIHSEKENKSKNGLFIWGQELFLRYNYHDVLTLTLTRKNLKFSLPGDQNQYITLDGDEMGDILLYNEKKYYFSRKLDGRAGNSIKFMEFKKDEGFEHFRKTQLYHYQNLMTKLENFLQACDISYESLDFQADHYLENSFIKNIESAGTLEIINNSGTDLTESEKQFLENFLKTQDISAVSFYNFGKTISIYERMENEEENCWRIKQVTRWDEIEPDQEKNYLVFNKILDEESESSMAYQYNGLWYSAEKDTKEHPTSDFYSQLKKKISYLNTGKFVSIQGMNINDFRIIKKKGSNDRAVIFYGAKGKDEKKGKNNEAQLSLFDDEILNGDKDQITPEFRKILIELGIKNWVRCSLVNPDLPLPVKHQSFSEKRFFAIYVRSPKKQEAKAVAVEFLYKEGYIRIKSIFHGLKEIENRFPILRKRKNDPEKVQDNQQYYIDEETQTYISAYTNDFFTPTLIGRENIIDDLESGTLEINRKKNNKLLPLVLCYNDDVQRVKNLICLDLKNEKFIQYYVPPAQSLGKDIKKGFRVYHLIGKTYSKKDIPTNELIRHPLTALHFGTLTQNVLKISENSQSSLLQKVAKIFIEN